MTLQEPLQEPARAVVQDGEWLAVRGVQGVADMPDLEVPNLREARLDLRARQSLHPSERALRGQRVDLYRCAGESGHNLCGLDLPRQAPGVADNRRRPAP